ncbi:MAG: hypothetical protein BWY21_00369 [Parcubacteria group bacterium ADurb.Bin216]|nr:MAG: hypothetical protein BWY21_00369 [Parcubacteria group bacterium ADurb.Bin216]
MTGKIFIENYEGLNNSPERYRKWGDLGLYKNLNTVWVTPTRGNCATRVAFSWCNVVGAPNSSLIKMCVEGFEVGKAYNEALKTILTNPVLKNFNYLLTVEEDNCPPTDGLLKLYESIQQYDVVGGLYWIKGEAGAPMIWGDPKEPYTYQPQPPQMDAIQQCNGLGMGFTLFRMDIFKNPGFEFGDWFKTVGEKTQFMTQDLYFFKKAQELGYKFACDTRVKVGHYNQADGLIW